MLDQQHRNSAPGSKAQSLMPKLPDINKAPVNTSSSSTGAPVIGAQATAPSSSSSSSSTNFKLNIISVSSAPQKPQSLPSTKPSNGITDTQQKVALPEDKPTETNSSQKLSAVLLTTIDFPSPDLDTLRKQTTLARVRETMKKKFPSATPFSFCNEEGACAPDTINLEAYFAGLKKPPSALDTTFNIFVTAVVPSGMTAAIIAALLSKPFFIKFLRVLDSKSSNIEGSLDSSIFKGKSASGTRLNVLRGFVKSMSVDARQDTFCLPDGTPIQDDVAFEQYLLMAKPAINQAEKVPSIPIFIKKASLVAVQPTSNFSSAGSGGGISGLGGARGGQSGSAGIDQSVLAKLGSLDLAFTDRSGKELRRDQTNLQVTETLNQKDYAASGASTLAHAGKLNEAEWDLILKNCNAFYGWIIDFDGNKIGRAPHAAFRLRQGLNLEKVKIKIEEDAPTPTEQPPAETKSEEKQIEGNGKTDDEKAVVKAAPPPPKPKPLQVEDVQEFMPRKPQGIPNFSVTDDSTIEVAAYQHEFAQSMAENHFDKTTFEIEASGVIKGVTVGAQGGVSTENESGKTSSFKTMSKTLVATYRIPRVTVFLPAEDLEPTDEFAAAIAKIKDSQNLFELRKLHRMYGQIFCTEIVLGGCLQTTKTLTADETKEETLTRNKFKGSVGIAVGVPKIASGSMKASHETQVMKEEGSRSFRQQEHMSFNATGGNTILAADPPSWLGSVGSDFNNWRVIQQRQLKPLVDVVSDIPKYEEVRMWFLQAVPKLTEYIVIPQTRTLDARFKVLFQLEGLSRALASLHVGRDHQESKDEDVGLTRSTQNKGLKIQTYLAHNPEQPPTFIRTYVKQIPHMPLVTKAPLRSENGKMIVDVTTKIYQTVNTTTQAIFQPSSTQAPVLIDPRAFPVESTNKDNPVIDKRTVWRMEVPYGYSLTHGSLVSIKSLAKDGKSISLTVYRNAQGVFLPAITSSEDPIYWRVLKANPQGGADAKQLKYGDAVRLSWSFTDQSSGWRDYYDDYYGRRRFDRPSELKEGEDSLYLKAPFPRFEELGSAQGMSLVMSPASNTNPILQTFMVRDPSKPSGSEEVAYNLFDLSFRMDFVGRNGNGEVFDYMNVPADDDTFNSRVDLEREWTDPQKQNILDVGSRVVNHVGSTYVKQFDNVVNAVSSGSPGTIAKELFKGALMVNPVGAITKIFGLW
ncbi:unnamed protein product [Clonostachys rosea]|uniref:MACPF-like domain-containing protein n=1 Tax=Bionectria ochroleuca TaxID=29856 RepID=A0ABY6UN53_BIOOC|nr:unnamed protein product [Clonostachys rosea]